MNKHFLKNIRDNIPEPIKHLTAPVFRHKLIGNKDFKDYLKLLEEGEHYSHEKIEAYQLQELKRVLKYSYDYVPYYKRLFDKIGFDVNNVASLHDIDNIPFLTKALIKENFHDLTSTAKVDGGYYVATTGGSTGEPLKVLLDYTSIFKENAFVYHFRKKAGYSFNDKLATFRGVEFGDKLWKLNPMHREMIFSPFRLSKLTIEKYVEQINKFRPQFLNGYLSSLYFFAKLVQESNLTLKLNLKGIFLISENIVDEQRSFLEDFFKVRSHTFYGHSERCVIANEETKGLYKISPFYGYTELVSQEEGHEIVSTGFLNRTMPLIRYKTGDICQKVGEYISIQGRWNVGDYLVGHHDEKIFHSAFNFHSEIFKNVTNYQFVQREKGKADLLLIVNKEFEDDELDFMRKEIDRKTKGVIDFEIKVVDILRLSPRGKFKRFISQIEEV